MLILFDTPGRGLTLSELNVININGGNISRNTADIRRWDFDQSFLLWFADHQQRLAA